MYLVMHYNILFSAYQKVNSAERFISNVSASDPTCSSFCISYVFIYVHLVCGMCFLYSYDVSRNLRNCKQCMRSSLKTYIRSFVSVNIGYSVLKIR